MITNPIDQQEYLTWCNHLQQACALELVSTFLERWAAGRFYILKCHCCQKVDGFPSVENKLRGEKRREKKRNLLCGCFNVSCYSSVKNRKALLHAQDFLVLQEGGVAVCLLSICIGTDWPLGLGDVIIVLSVSPVSITRWREELEERLSTHFFRMMINFLLK